MLPEAFEDLQTLASAGWCLGTESERVEKRHKSSPAELRTFYDLMVPRLESAIEHLNQFDLKDFPAREQHLMHLLLSMAEVTFAVEKFDADESAYDGLPADRFVPVHEHAAGGLYTPFEYK